MPGVAAPPCASCGEAPHPNQPWPGTSDAARAPGTCTSYQASRPCCRSRAGSSDYHRPGCPVAAHNEARAATKHAAALQHPCSSSACRKHAVQPGQACRFADGRVRLTPHSQREEAARRAADAAGTAYQATVKAYAARTPIGATVLDQGE